MFDVVVENLASAKDDCLELNIEKILRFFDEDAEGRQHASSIKGVIGEELAFACMVKYFESIGSTATLLIEGDGKRIPCTTVSKPGFRLDGWLEVSSLTETVLYQTEVKSWSFHGYASSGRRLPVTPQEGIDGAQIMLANLETYRKALRGAGEGNYDAVRKVLFEMQAPRGRKDDFLTKPPRALLCIWEGVRREGDSVGLPFFPLEVEPFAVANRFVDKVPCNGGNFSEIDIFSVSNFLRSLLISENGSKTIPLNLPMISERIRILRALLES